MNMFSPNTTLVGKLFDRRRTACQWLAKALSLTEEDLQEIKESGLDAWLNIYGYEWDIAGASCKEGYVIGVPVATSPDADEYACDCYYAEEHFYYVFPSETDCNAYMIV